MANVIISPNMNLPVPTVSLDPGPDWATNIDGCMSAIDGHDHTSGKGVPVTPNGMSINTDLPINQNNLITVRSVRFAEQSAPIAGAADLACIYASGVDLYYNDGSGNQVRITQGGSVSGSSGTITGLPSGTASASFSVTTFTFQSATNTPAIMAVGPLVIGRNTASPKTVTLAPNSGQASNYNLTLPAALPASTSALTVDNAGTMSSLGLAGLSGNIVLEVGATLTNATIVTSNLTSPSITGGTVSSSTIASPTFSGTSSGTITDGTYSPTVTAGTDGTAQAAVANSFVYTRINNMVTVWGQVSGTTAGNGRLDCIVTLPIAPTSNFSALAQVTGVGSCLQTSSVTAVVPILGSKTIRVALITAAAAISFAPSVSFTYNCA